MGGKRRRRAATQAIRYRDPENPDNVWNGRGRMPAWLHERIGEGRDLTSFEVIPEAPPHANGAAQD